MTMNKTITIEMTKEAAHEVINNLDDIICWLQGFKAGGGEYYHTTDDLQSLSKKIKAEYYKDE